ncbi:hypothetical protein JTB14_026236 [Gonioctena quinquepunctata]|nr:hypothetical protein JTB14_026236 [Gonioctena quinquepunctata]
MYSDIYVDNVVTGSETLHQVEALQSELVSLLSRGGFQLRKWSANHQFPLNVIPPEDCRHDPFSFDNQESIIKVLGMKCYPTQDCFSYEISLGERPCTKRGMLSVIARLFNHVGLVCPITSPAKYLIQHFWSSGLTWDETPPSYVSEKWSIFEESYKFFPLWKYPDVLFPIITKVAPLETIVLSELELCAAVLLSKSMHYVILIYSSSIKFPNTLAWSDSMIGLSVN